MMARPPMDDPVDTGYIALAGVIGTAMLLGAAVVIGFKIIEYWQLADNPAPRDPVAIRGCAEARLDSALDGRKAYQITGCPDGMEYWIIQIAPTTKGETPNGQRARRVQTYARRQG